MSGRLCFGDLSSRETQSRTHDPSRRPRRRFSPRVAWSGIGRDPKEAGPHRLRGFPEVKLGGTQDPGCVFSLYLLGFKITSGLPTIPQRRPLAWPTHGCRVQPGS